MACMGEAEMGFVFGWRVAYGNGAFGVYYVSAHTFHSLHGN
jgi:hypothetical protein